ncbi:hypothetical protein THAOC_25949 [Thalassiosira oceanica]|uniref:B30.2/SPRY domain-containing protein n=1 Tax=Thalassiosira oceanica TaxID=159749 RepID=K0RMQ8_THAOC|nr:hypothetical protein THAOC_25949 [Thalassiosira oceanica]|eukprot:EJK54425.1 hypothetical protein THAOC_25949 [Thalassiosira oceanica]
MEARLTTLEAIVRQQQGEIQHLRDRVGLLEAGHVPESNKRAKLAPPPADAFSPLGDEAVAYCASYLGACELVQLGRTCRRFGAGRDGGQLSLVDGAACQIFHETATADEKECLTRYEGEETHVKILPSEPHIGGDGNVNCCTYFGDGACYWSSGEGEGRCKSGDREWSGNGAMGFDPCTIGLLLDLNAGTLTVYKNSRRLGVMKRGLTGEYCWMVTLLTECIISVERDVPPE